MKKRTVLIPLLIAFIFCGCAPRGIKLYKKRFVALGTIINISSPQRQAVDMAYRRIKELESVFDFYNPQSQVSLINKNAAIKPVKVDKEVFECISLALEVSELTDGYFDITVGPITDFWKDKIKEQTVKDLDVQKAQQLKELVNYHDVILDEELKTVFLKRKGQKIDLGGIAKGYIVDKAIQHLKENGITSCLIDAGGDIYALGKKGNDPWMVAIRHPKDSKKVVYTLPIGDESLATSGDYEQFFVYKGKKYSHIINPLTGLPVEGTLLSTSVKAHNLTTADSLATAFFAMGFEKTQEFLLEHKHTIKVWLVKESPEGLHTFKF